MNWIEIVTALAAGFAIGLLYFGGLWWTVKQLASSQRPLSFYLASFALRMIACIACFFFVLSFGTVSLLIALAGFFTARLMLVSLKVNSKPSPNSSKAIH